MCCSGIWRSWCGNTASVCGHTCSRSCDPDIDKFSALHAACWSCGTLLYVPRGVTIDEPLHALSAIADQGVDLGHTLVILEDGAEATFLNEMASQHADRTAGCIAVPPN